MGSVHLCRGFLKLWWNLVPSRPRSFLLGYTYSPGPTLLPLPTYWGHCAPGRNTYIPLTWSMPRHNFIVEVYWEFSTLHFILTCRVICVCVFWNDVPSLKPPIWISTNLEDNEQGSSYSWLFLTWLTLITNTIRIISKTAIWIESTTEESPKCESVWKLSKVAMTEKEAWVFVCVLMLDLEAYGCVRSWVMKSELLKSRKTSLRLWHSRELFRAIQLAS